MIACTSPAGISRLNPLRMVIAPSFTSEALEILKGKKNRILLIQKLHDLPETITRSCLNGALVQDR
ncbi:MAG: hypothetical protein EX271_08190, partial [Acidimicrobiales bacterium]